MTDSLHDVFIGAATRSPIGRYGGGLAGVRPDDLAAHVVRALHAACADSETVEEVILGAANQAGEDNRNVARMAALLAGLPETVTGCTINRLCGSGLEAVTQAYRAVRLGDMDAVIAGGIESMSRAPWVVAKPERAFPRGAPPSFDTSLGWRFRNPKLAERFELQTMGDTAENVAEQHGVTREDQDAFALGSHQKAARAWERGWFDDEVVPVPLPAGRRGTPPPFARDESIRQDTSMEKLSALKPVFRDSGTVTAGNASPLNDGAAAVLVTNKRGLERLGLQPLAKIRGAAVAGVHPNLMGIGPVPATRRLLGRVGLAPGEVNCVELNEAFAAQAVACVRELGFDEQTVNAAGGALALGHPLGCSGARILVTLAHRMKREESRYGVATMCIGVGQGIALLLERVDK